MAWNGGPLDLKVDHPNRLFLWSHTNYGLCASGICAPSSLLYELLLLIEGEAIVTYKTPGIGNLNRGCLLPY